MEVNKPWKSNDINKYYIISLDKETNEWKFFKEIIGHTVFWKDEPSRYGMTKSKAIEILNIVKNLTNEDETTTTSTEPSETPTNSTEPSEDNTDPETSTGEPTVPTELTEESQYKIITISSVTYNSKEIAIFDDADYHKLKTTLTYIYTTYPNTNTHVVVAETDTGKTIFYFYLDEELTWFLELKTNIDYALVSNITTLGDIKELL